jgi:hypothetical protein
MKRPRIADEDFQPGDAVTYGGAPATFVSRTLKHREIEFADGRRLFVAAWRVKTAKNPAAVSLGRLGGQATSAAKAAAARTNGQRGGRPLKRRSA